MSLRLLKLLDRLAYRCEICGQWVLPPRYMRKDHSCIEEH